MHFQRKELHLSQIFVWPFINLVPVMSHLLKKNTPMICSHNLVPRKIVMTASRNNIFWQNWGNAFQNINNYPKLWQKRYTWVKLNYYSPKISILLFQSYCIVPSLSVKKRFSTMNRTKLSCTALWNDED